MMFIARFALVARILIVTYAIVVQASGPRAWFAYVVLAWALAPYFYVLLQLRVSKTAHERVTRSVMSLGIWLASLYLSVQSLGQNTPSESQPLWLFGPLLQWLLMLIISMLMAIVFLRGRRR